ncbi:hypothetical protein D3C73_1636410 [compost metagenome]
MSSAMVTYWTGQIQLQIQIDRSWNMLLFITIPACIRFTERKTAIHNCLLRLIQPCQQPAFGNGSFH